MNEEITPPQKEASARQEVLENESYDEKVSRITRVLKEAKDRLQEKTKAMEGQTTGWANVIRAMRQEAEEEYSEHLKRLQERRENETVGADTKRT